MHAFSANSWAQEENSVQNTSNGWKKGRDS